MVEIKGRRISKARMKIKRLSFAVLVMLVCLYYMKISVFGNPDLKEDNAGIKLIPWLKQKYPEAEIKIEDPVESLKPVDDWIIVDACAGINKITEFEDLDKFEAARRVSVHDYEVAMELKLLKKLGKIKKLKIIAVPMAIIPEVPGRK